MYYLCGKYYKPSCCCCSVAKSHPTLCNPMDCSTPGFSVFHYLLEFAQTHVHWVSDAIQPSHPLLPPLSVFNLSQHQGLFQWVSSSHQVAKVLELQIQHQSFQWIFIGWFSINHWLIQRLISFRIDWFDLLADSQEPSPVPQFEGISSLALSLFYCMDLTSVHDVFPVVVSMPIVDGYFLLMSLLLGSTIEDSSCKLISSSTVWEFLLLASWLHFSEFSLW